MRLHILTGLLLGLFTATASAAPDARLWERWQSHASDSTDTIDHSAFDSFLQTYVVVHDNAPNGVRYADVGAADRAALDQYLERMQRVDIDAYNRGVQRAYWINLYNAATLDLILEHYPVESIREIGGGLFSSGPWDDKLLRVAGERLSLNDIEHRILRPIWGDGMTHYGVNCASMSCPSLRATAYTGDNVSGALRANAREYVNSPAGVRIDDDRVTVSSIYDWYRQDFGNSARSVISHLRQFADAELSARLDMHSRVDAYAYDWSLNDEQRIDAPSS